MNKTKKRILSIIPALSMMIIIFCFSSQTAETSSESSYSIATEITNLIGRPDSVFVVETIIRKLAHCFEYALLAVCISFHFSIAQYKYCNRFLSAMIVTVLYATTDEIHQLFVPGRSGQLRDVFIDSIGALMGCLLFSYIFNKIKKRNL